MRMTSADIYTLALGTFIVVHRLPAVFSPRFFRKVYNGFADRLFLVRLTGLCLLLFSGWGIYAGIVDYEKPGWFIIGLSIFIFIKALCYLLLPRRITRADRRANEISDARLSLISLAMVCGGLAILLLVFILPIDP